MSLTIEQHFDRITQGTYDSNPYKADYITTAIEQTSQCYYGKNYNLAVALLAAHYITLNTDPSRSGSAVSGAVSGKREGGLSVSFADASAAIVKGGSADLTQTTHGLQLAHLQKGTGPWMGVTGTYSCVVRGS